MRIRRMAAVTAMALVAAVGTVVPASVVGGAAGSAQAATSGGTIVFIKGDNVWVARGDGSGQTRITTDGTKASPYAEPSMSDNGRIAVMKGNRIRVINQSGKVLNTMSPGNLFVEGGVRRSGSRPSWSRPSRPTGSAWPTPSSGPSSTPAPRRGRSRR
ncbi:hypothetical protein [Nocardioides alcanivorans]|uniref:hypothetical protein n=1 Tax=Nocardioides alcanivorans TaxID=2897352 RepID=UPI001F3CA975|nr:hypothetical protein [Nocardioides alcanivorans]